MPEKLFAFSTISITTLKARSLDQNKIRHFKVLSDQTVLELCVTVTGCD